jgi:hypothetical protein
MERHGDILILVKGLGVEEKHGNMGLNYVGVLV